MRNATEDLPNFSWTGLENPDRRSTSTSTSISNAASMGHVYDSPAVHDSQSIYDNWTDSGCELNDVGNASNNLEHGTDTPQAPEEMDGVEGEDPIVVCGFSIKFPQDAATTEGLWRMMLERRCAMTDFPPERLNLEGFYNKKNLSNTIPVRGGHFLEEDLSVFDADFFSIPPTEANSMDPMQRWLLEAAYRALENAGMPMESVAGSRTGVYTGSFGFDYMLQLCRDPENPPMYAALGFGISMLANRLSWFFNLRGPSIGLDSACSSTAMGVDIACQALKNRSCDMAMVAGCNITSSPESFLWMSNIGFLSPDSRCHSFDHRANGYARGEGVGVVVLKRLSDALRDGNTIRAVIRSCASNEDGRTPGITQPSGTAQEELIGETYRKAGLAMGHTRFFEAHGTGTAIGDPREAQAIGRSFRKYRSSNDPVYVGALKSNIGHLEGASGLAALIKTVLVLERAVIPPNANFERLNPKIDAQYLKLKFPQEPCAWPTDGLRRASLNSFGYGGANCHLVLDDAYNYLRIRGLSGKHCTLAHPPRNLRSVGSATIASEDQQIRGQSQDLRLLVWSSADKAGTSRMAALLEDWTKPMTVRSKQLQKGPLHATRRMSDLAYTLDTHRSQLPWRSFAVLRSFEDVCSLESQASAPIRSHTEPPRLGYVFSGQGTQWFAMGRELMCYDTYRTHIIDADDYLKRLGCTWSLHEELMKSRSDSRLDHPEFSQTACTVLQLALVDLLRDFNVRPSASVGHSSGEIAAAYAAGYISLESAVRVAYYRGVCSATLVTDDAESPAGAMVSVAASRDEAQSLIDSIDQTDSGIGLSIACVNSPKNVTISGDVRLIDQVHTHFDTRGVFARKLRVPVAYHSRQMDAIAVKYTKLIGSLDRPKHGTQQIPMISSVTGKPSTATQLLDPSYWALNMTSTVEFTQAVSVMCERSRSKVSKKIDRSHRNTAVVDYLLELGPHATLQGPLREILHDHVRGQSIIYSAVLQRNHCAVETTLRAIGELYCNGYPVNVRAANTPASPVQLSPSLLVDLPEYSFDHSQRYWDESRLSRNYRLRPNAPDPLLGVRSRDWNSSDARWRLFIRPAEVPWVEQHIINGLTLYPAAGMLVMAIEAARQLAGSAGNIDGYALEDVHIEGPMDLGSGDLEVQTYLRRIHSEVSDEHVFDFVISCWAEEDWIVNCRGRVSAFVQVPSNGWINDTKTLEMKSMVADLCEIEAHCQEPVDSTQMYSYLRRAGYDYGTSFQIALQQHCGKVRREATAQVPLWDSVEGRHVVHPVCLDAILHLAFTALTFGGSKPMATSIPCRIGYMWVAADWNSTQAIAGTRVQKITTTGFTCSGGASDARTPDGVKLWFEEFELINIASAPESKDLLPNPKQFCMTIERNPALQMLTSTEVGELLREQYPVTQNLSSFYKDVQALARCALGRLIRDCETFTDDSWRQHYWNWAQHQLTRQDAEATDVKSRVDEQELSQRVADSSDVGRVYAAVASNLVAFYKNDANPLELLLDSGLLKNFYQEWAGYEFSQQAAGYMDLLSHQKPGMKILEVGAGTGATTRNLTGVLRMGTAARSLRCARYDFTDISPAFLESAREEFSDFASQMTFGTLNIDQSFAKQGYDDGSYDVIAADNVLHVTSVLGKVLQNVRRALRPGGKLILHELLRPTGWTAGFIFGLFPGWWLGTKDGRTLSANLSVESWDTILKQNGFSGVDFVLRDFEDNDAHQLGWLVATAEDKTLHDGPSTTARTQEMVIVADDTSTSQRLLADDLQRDAAGLFAPLPRVLDLTTAASEIQRLPVDALVVVLLDYGTSFLSSMNEWQWSAMSMLVQNTRRLMWVSAGGGRHAAPDHGILDGFGRTLRSEFYDLHFVTVGLNHDDGTSKKTKHLLAIAREMLGRQAHTNYEQEYYEINGMLHTQRLVEASGLKHAVDAGVSSYRAYLTTPDGNTSFDNTSFDFSTTSVLTSVQGPFYKEAGTVAVLENNDSVGIQVKAVSLPDQNRTTLASQDDGARLGTYCAGIVYSCNAEGPCFVGDRVFAAHPGSYRSHIQAPSGCAVRIPATLSFADACLHMPPAVVVHHALIEVGQVKTQESVMVHDGHSQHGRAAIRLLLSRGVTDVWTSVFDQKEKDWAVDVFKLSADRVVPIQWFESQSTSRFRRKRTFDLVISQNNSSTSLKVDYVKDGGRYIIMSSTLSIASEERAIRATARNVTVVKIDYGTSRSTALASSASLAYAVKAALQLKDQAEDDQSAILPASRLTDIFSRLQSADRNEYTVVEFNDDDKIEVLTQRRETCKINSDGTYVIAGGLGGLGRAIARWLASRGARYLILLSRSGAKEQEAIALLQELNGKGVLCEAPRCNISNRQALRSVLKSCADRMPPVKGCIQSTMVMTEVIFQKMTFQDWKRSTDPKVEGSRNLHEELPGGLDFFILFSSIMGILGTVSLAGYNAGNTYEDALAHYRRSQGERAVTINIGGVRDAGYFITHAEKLEGIERDEKHALTYVEEICALMEIFCDPNNPSANDPRLCQAIIGMRPPAHWKHAEEPCFTVSQPFWGHMHHIAPLSDTVSTEGVTGAALKQSLDALEQLATAGSISEAAEIVTAALIQRVSSLIGKPVDRIEEERPMHSFGIDSLSAIDIRNWVGKIFDVDLPVFDILGGATFASAGLLIAHKIRARNAI